MSFPSITTIATLLLSLLFGATADDSCSTGSRPNPIAQQYPDDATGTLNTTLLVVPIPYETARQLVPAQWGILKHAYHALLPGFPADMYPVVLQAGLDHDIQLLSLGVQVPDFMKISWLFPFIDLLGDGYSSFVWSATMLIQADNELAIEGSRAYGTPTYPSTFDPPCDAYGTRPNGVGYFHAKSTDVAAIYADVVTRPVERRCDAHYPLELFKNVTNQPIFGNGTTCDKQIRLFNTSLSAPPYEARAVQAKVSTNMPPLSQNGLGNVFGWQVDTAFIEFNTLDCQSLQGYSGS